MEGEQDQQQMLSEQQETPGQEEQFEGQQEGGFDDHDQQPMAAQQDDIDDGQDDGQEQMMQQQMQMDEQQLAEQMAQMSPEQQEAMQMAIQQQQYEQALMAQGQHPGMMAQMQMHDAEEMGEQFYDQAHGQGHQNNFGQEQYDQEQYDDEEFGRQQQQYDQEEVVEQSKEEQMNNLMHQIEEMCQDSGELWCDTAFPADDSSLYINTVVPPKYDAPHNLEWKRPHEIYQGEGEPMMMKDGFSPGDVKQGQLGDCWLLGAFLCLATNPELLRNLIYHDGIASGYAVFRFFKNGEWTFVVVDTRIPYNPSHKEPAYARCTDPQEFWVPLIEKAYAKLHKKYEFLHGGKMGEGMVDISGGVSEKYNLKAPETIIQIENGSFWKMIKSYLKQGFLVGCANSQKGENGTTEEGTGPSGITFNHAYGLLRVEDVTASDQLQLLYIRNPWGTGPGEWTGRFCDEDEAWDDQLKLRENLGYQFLNDGNWWMDYKDWKANYNKIYVCKIFPSSWQQFSIRGEWKGITAGGPYPAEADRDEEHKDTKVHLDTNDRWFNNPQYRLTVTKKTQIIISLMQEDFALSGKPYIPVNFLVVRVRSKRERLWEVDRDDIVEEAATGLQRFKQREITRTIWLSPTHNNKPVHYIIVPNIEAETIKSSDERPFFLRLFASETVDLIELPPTQVWKDENCKWEKNTAGGRRVDDKGRENQFWCRNPQFFLNIQKPTYLKIIIQRKKKGRRVTGNPIGLTVTKANPPTQPPAAQIIGKGKDRGKVTLPSTLPHLGMPYAQTLRSGAMKEKGGDNIPDFEPPSLADQLERKLQIEPNEWYQETTYKSDDTAALYAFYQPTQGPFIVVPSTASDTFQAEYTLTIYSSQPVEVQQLPDSRNVVLASAWDKRSAGGCHLYDKEYEQKPDAFTWMQNPKFLLKLETREPTTVKITLSRPERAWKKQIGMALVGSMIGFYVYPAKIQPTKDNVLNKDSLKFVPWCQYHEELVLEGLTEGYLIMPTTYEPNKLGPFNISVSTSVEFTLKPQQDE